MERLVLAGPRAWLVVLPFLLAAGADVAHAQAQRYFGPWRHDANDRVIEIGNCSEPGPICGRVVRILDPATGKDGDQNQVGRDGKRIVGSVVLQQCAESGTNLRYARSYTPTTGATHDGITVSIESNGRLRTGTPLGATWWMRER